MLNNLCNDISNFVLGTNIIFCFSLPRNYRLRYHKERKCFIDILRDLKFIIFYEPTLRKSFKAGIEIVILRMLSLGGEIK